MLNKLRHLRGALAEGRCDLVFCYILLFVTLSYDYGALNCEVPILNLTWQFVAYYNPCMWLDSTNKDEIRMD